MADNASALIRELKLIRELRGIRRAGLNTGEQMSAQPPGVTQRDIQAQAAVAQTPAPNSDFIKRQAFGGGSAFGAGAADAPLEEMFSLSNFQEEMKNPAARIGLGGGIDFGAEMSGSQIGATAGRIAGSRFGPAGKAVGTAAGRIIGGGTASVLSALAQKKVAGEDIAAQDVGNEILLSFLPEVMESSVRASVRQVAKRGMGGKELLMDEGAKVAKKSAPRVFDSPGRKSVSAKFQEVEKSGIRFDLTQLRSEFGALPDKLKDVLRLDVRTIDSQGRTGKRFAKIVQAIQDGDNVPIGDLQDLRSILLKREGKTTQEARRVIENFRLAVDEAVDTAPAISGGTRALDEVDDVRALLKEARGEWRRVRSAEDLAALMSTRPVTSLARQGRIVRFNMNALLNNLRDNKTGLARAVNESMTAVPGKGVADVAGIGTRPQAFADYIEEIKNIVPENVTLTHTQGLARFPGVAAASNVMADMLTSQLGQRVFRRAIVEGRGTLSTNNLAMLYNAIRKQSENTELTRDDMEALAHSIVESVFGGAPQFPDTAGAPR